MLTQEELQLCFNNLTQKSWSSHLNILDKNSCQNLLKYIDLHLEQENFKIAQIGNKLNKIKKTSIRSSKIAWIDNWEANHELKSIYHSLLELQNEFNHYFFMALKRFESQFAFYEKGDFYKKHLDQLNNTRHRQVTLILYLNDIPDGGELVIYNKDNKMQVETIIKPKMGELICFFSGHIFHEVLPTNFPRYSITTWFRDDLIVF
jgi:SM-20-related protein